MCSLFQLLLVFRVADFKHLLIHVHECLNGIVDQSVDSPTEGARGNE